MSFKNLNEGQDSFLDIIANLVGVLIILVVVVGAQATSSLVSQQSEQAAAIPEVAQTEEVIEEPESDLAFEQKSSQLRAELSKLESTAEKFRFDRIRLEQQADDERMIGQQLATRRHAMLMQLETVRAAHEKRKQQLSDKLDLQQQAQLQLQAEKIQLVARLESIEKATSAVAATRIESTVETIDHFPNPIAKTVFSDEIHFRLDRGRISWVPMDELVEQMKGELRLKAEKLKQARETRETIGPIDGFRLQYELGLVPDSETGQANSRIVRFQRFTIQPTNLNGGELMDEALAANSQFLNRLRRYEPRRTTVSVWVYPNSFEEHAKLKEWLYERGFQMASWPLSNGRPISGGPNGFRTSAQ